MENEISVYETIYNNEVSHTSNSAPILPKSNTPIYAQVRVEFHVMPAHLSKEFVVDAQ
jgi:hypothetical protein